jgi:hypothetical protein
VWVGYPARLALLFAGDVFGLGAVFGGELDDEAEQQSLGHEEPESDDHHDQPDEVVDVASETGRGFEICRDHDATSLEDKKDCCDDERCRARNGDDENAARKAVWCGLFSHWFPPWVSETSC